MLRRKTNVTVEDRVMTTETAPHTARVIGIAPQFLVDDLNVSLPYYRDKLGFGIDFIYESFYAGVSRDGCTIHLKCAPKALGDRAHRKQHEHLDAHLSVTGVAALHEELRSRGAPIIKSPE